MRLAGTGVLYLNAWQCLLCEETVIDCSKCQLFKGRTKCKGGEIIPLLFIQAKCNWGKVLGVGTIFCCFVAESLTQL